LQNSGVYSITCSCRKVYIGETGRTVEKRLHEHIRHNNSNNFKKLAAALQSAETGHAILFDQSTLFASKDTRRCLRREIKENILTKNPII
ncbi:hypothetical protein C0J52_09581, partial [Blattella germanica]